MELPSPRNYYCFVRKYYLPKNVNYILNFMLFYVCNLVWMCIYSCCISLCNMHTLHKYQRFVKETHLLNNISLLRNKIFSMLNEICLQTASKFVIFFFWSYLPKISLFQMCLLQMHGLSTNCRNIRCSDQSAIDFCYWHNTICQAWQRFHF